MMIFLRVSKSLVHFSLNIYKNYLIRRSIDNQMCQLIHRQDIFAIYEF